MPETSILVTGGTSFIGSHLVERLVARGDRDEVAATLEGSLTER
jgi:nucleoside-diphosphate-sugar epimerase